MQQHYPTELDPYQEMPEEVNHPTFTAPDFRVPTLQRVDLETPDLDMPDGLIPSPLVRPDIEDMSEDPGAPVDCFQNVEPIYSSHPINAPVYDPAPDVRLTMPPEHTPEKLVRTDIVGKIDPPMLPEGDMPGALAVDAFGLLHRYDQSPDVPPDELYTHQDGMSHRGRHLQLLEDGVDGETKNYGDLVKFQR